ncbi:MAG: hypothetical protein U5K36_07375 [Roseovarius sp.]|nr:hypothetical protein [Roseovarius sp.]
MARGQQHELNQYINQLRIAARAPRHLPAGAPHHDVDIVGVVQQRWLTLSLSLVARPPRGA